METYMNLSDAKKLEEARFRVEEATAAIKLRNDNARNLCFKAVVTQFREYFEANDFSVHPTRHGAIASIGNTEFRLEFGTSNVANTLATVKLTPPTESNEMPTEVLIASKQSTESSSTTIHVKQHTPLQELENKAEIYEAKLRQPLPDVVFALRTAANGRYMQYDSFSDVLGQLYPVA
jgi:hypothetical protein